MTPKQASIVDFLYDWFVEGGGPIGVPELADSLGYTPSGMALTIYSLRSARLIEVEKANGVGGCGSAHSIIAVHHPHKGSALPEPVAYDMFAECWRFKADLAELVHRSCLSCASIFETPSRFIRFCNTCKATDEWMAGEDGGDYLSNGQAILTNRTGGFRRVG